MRGGTQNLAEQLGDVSHLSFSPVLQTDDQHPTGVLSLSPLEMSKGTWSDINVARKSLIKFNI